MSTALTPPVDEVGRDSDLTPRDALPVFPTSRAFRFAWWYRQRIVAITILLIFSTALAVVVWPGRMSADTLVQLEQVRFGEYSDWHAALLLILYRPFWLVGFGPGWVTWAAVVTFSLGLYGLLRLRFGRPAAVLLTMAFSLSPQVVAWVIYLGRDMWFTAFFLVGCAALVRIARFTPRRSRAGIVLLLVSTWLALAARQNGLPACAVLILAAVAFLWPEPKNATARARLVHRVGVVARAGAVLLVIVGSQWFARRIFDVESRNIEQSIYIYDLVAISHEERKVLLDPEFFPAQDLALLDARWNPSSFEPLVFGPDAIIPYPLEEEAVAELRSDWLDAVTTYPASYLEERFRVWLEQLAITEPSVWIVHPGIDANPWGYAAANPALDDALQGYIRASASNDHLTGGVVHRVWVYMLVLIAGLWYLRSASPVRRCLGWMSAACLAYQGSLLFGLMGSGYRFNVPCVVAALVVASVAIADVIDARRHRSAANEVAEADGAPAAS